MPIKNFLTKMANRNANYWIVQSINQSTYALKCSARIVKPQPLVIGASRCAPNCLNHQISNTMRELQLHNGEKKCCSLKQRLHELQNQQLLSIELKELQETKSECENCSDCPRPRRQAFKRVFLKQAKESDVLG